MKGGPALPRAAAWAGVVLFVLSFAAMGFVRSPPPVFELDDGAWLVWLKASPAGVAAFALTNLVVWVLTTVVMVTLVRHLPAGDARARRFQLAVTVASLAVPTLGLAADLLLAAAAWRAGSTADVSEVLPLLHLEHRVGHLGGSFPVGLAAAAFLFVVGFGLRTHTGWRTWVSRAGVGLGSLVLLANVAGLFITPVGAYAVSPTTPVTTIFLLSWLLVVSIGSLVGRAKSGEGIQLA